MLCVCAKPRNMIHIKWYNFHLAFMLFMHFLFASCVIANFKLQEGLFFQNEERTNQTRRRKASKKDDLGERIGGKSQRTVLFEPFYVSYSSVKFSQHYLTIGCWLHVLERCWIVDVCGYITSSFFYSFIKYLLLASSHHVPWFLRPRCWLPDIIQFFSQQEEKCNRHTCINGRSV